jgi:hypothetical protein
VGDDSGHILRQADRESNRTGIVPSGDFDLGGSLYRLASGPDKQVFAVKISHWRHPYAGVGTDAE